MTLHPFTATTQAPRHRPPPPGFTRWEDAMERARTVPLLDVVDRLELGDPISMGGDLYLWCPRHEDAMPALLLEPKKGLWRCLTCTAGGDGLALAQLVARISLAAAVRRLVR